MSDDIEKVRAVCPECGSRTFEAFLVVGGAPTSPILYCTGCGNDGCVPREGDQ